MDQLAHFPLQMLIVPFQWLYKRDLLGQDNLQESVNFEEFDHNKQLAIFPIGYIA
jgi:hypothetical protein